MACPMFTPAAYCEIKDHVYKNDERKLRIKKKPPQVLLESCYIPKTFLHAIVLNCDKVQRTLILSGGAPKRKRSHLPTYIFKASQPAGIVQKWGNYFHWSWCQPMFNHSPVLHVSENWSSPIYSFIFFIFFFCFFIGFVCLDSIFTPAVTWFDSYQLNRVCTRRNV